MSKTPFIGAILLLLAFPIMPAIAQPNKLDSSPRDSRPEPETQVLISEIVIQGVDGLLRDEVYKVVRSHPGKPTTRSQLQADIDAIFATGYFANVKVVPTDTPLGVRITFIVEPNPVLKSVQIEGQQVLPAQVVRESFSSQYGKILNLRQLQEGVKKLNQWYQEHGYSLAQVIDTPKVSAEGNVVLTVAEGVIETVQIRFTNGTEEGKNPQEQSVKGHTRDFIITRELELKPGTVFNRDQAQKDLQRLYRLGIFQNVNLSLSPGQDPRKAIVTLNITEGKTFSISPTGGYSSTNGLFAAASLQAQNFGGNNQKLNLEGQIGQRALTFEANYTDPWIAGDPFHTSYTISGFRRQTISQIFDGGRNDVKLANGDRPRIYRTGGGITFTRPLSTKVFDKANWIATVGLQYQRVSVRDASGQLSPKDSLGNDLSFSGSGKDDLWTVPISLTNDQRNNLLTPTQGSVLRFSTEQSIPIGQGSVLSNKLRASYSFYIPTQLTHFTQGCSKPNPTAEECPQALAFNVQAGTIFGSLPPYEAFSLGGVNSVRGYREGDLGSARNFLQATVEYRFPVFSVISGALFLDAATDLGSSSSVVGNPGGVRGKPGSGFGYGAGVRIQSPLGPIRLDYGLNDRGESRIQFGFGERF
jgi:outer membrane protein insertion porin family